MSGIIITYEIFPRYIIEVLENNKKDCLLNHDHDHVIKKINEYRKLGPTVAAILEGKPLGIGGVGKIHNGLGVAWLILNKNFLKYPKSLLKISRKIIKDSFEYLDLHRIQMDIDIKYKENARFASKLGFSVEGRMYQYGPQRQDYDRYVMLRDKS